MTEGSPGKYMSAEIDEQPDVLGSLVETRAEIAAVARAVAARAPRFVLVAARGSSGHAARYGRYLTEVLLGLPSGSVSPSATTLYGANPDLRDVMLLTVSQSGGSPDLLEVTEAARARGALTVAVGNTPSSPLCQVAELSVDIQAGPEHAVAATKTYTATLLALYLLVDALRDGHGEHVRDIAELARCTLQGSASGVDRAVKRYRFADRVVTTARGYSYASARETALKLAETSYVAARAYSGADLLHGPVASVEENTAVLAVTSTGHGATAMTDVLTTLAQRGADILSVGSAGSAMPAALTIPVPETAEEVAPILEILPIQRLALHLALARGNDPDRPRGLRKVTKTL